MLNSRDIDKLRPDVAANCRIFVERCKAAGYPVLVTQTVRDAEYQAQLCKNGYAKTAVPSFHWDKVGLAFDVCKNVKGHEYDDANFWRGISKIGKEMGFTWGGDWKSFPDKPHFQWDDGGKYTSAMVRRLNLPPMMEEYDSMTQEDFNTMMDAYLAELGKKAASSWAAQSIADMKKQGVTDGARPRAFTTREEVLVMLDRMMKRG